MQVLFPFFGVWRERETNGMGLRPPHTVQVPPCGILSRRTQTWFVCRVRPKWCVLPCAMISCLIDLDVCETYRMVHTRRKIFSLRRSRASKYRVSLSSRSGSGRRRFCTVLQMSVAGRLGLSRQGARWWCAVVAKPLALPRRPAAASVRGLLIGRHSLPPRTRLDVGTRPLEANQCLAARLFSTQPITSATYRRFGQPPQGSRQGASGGFPVVYEQLGGLRSGGGGSGGNSGNRKGYDSSAKTILVVVVGGAGVYYYVHLERVPDTGRLRFIDISVAQEKALGQESFEQTMRQYRGQILPANDRRVQQVRRVAERIVAAAQAHQEQGSLDANHLAWAGGSATQHADTEWQVFVIQSKEKNAFVLPNGKIFVFSGILPICQDDDGLATVLGHEVRHGHGGVLGGMAILLDGYAYLAWTSTGCAPDCSTCEPIVAASDQHGLS